MDTAIGGKAVFYPGEGHTDPLTNYGDEIPGKIAGAR